MSDTVLEKTSLPLYTAGFVILACEPVSREGTYGSYQWGYRVRMRSASTTGKTYAVELRRDDATLGSILWVWNEAPNKGIVFTRALSGAILGSAKASPDGSLDNPPA